MSRESDEDGLFPSFEPLTVYDAPVLTMSRLLEGDVNWDTWKRTWLDPNSLSPKERERWTDALKDSIGRNRISDSFIDVVSNPFVWLMFLTTPGGATALKEGGRVFAGNAKAFMGWAGKDFPLLKSLNLLGAEQQFANTSIPTSLHMFAKYKEMLAKEESEMVGSALTGFLSKISDRFGVKVTSLNPDRAPNAAVKKFLTDFHLSAEGHLRGLDASGQSSRVAPRLMEKVRLLKNGKMQDAWVDRAQLESTVAKNVNGQDGILQEYVQTNGQWQQSAVHSKIKSGEVLRTPGGQVDVRLVHGSQQQRAIVAEGSLAKFIDDAGGTDYINALERLQQSRIVKLYGDEELWRRTGEFKVDRDKAARTMRLAIRDRKDQLINKGVLEGRAADEDLLFSDEIVDLFRSGGIKGKGVDGNPDELLDLAEQLVLNKYSIDVGGSRQVIGRGQGLMRPHSIDLMDSTGQVLDPSVAARGSRRVADMQALANGKIMESVLKSSMTYDQDDLLRLRELSESVVPASPVAPHVRAFDAEMAKIQRARQLLAQHDPSTPFRRVQRLNLHRSMTRFLNRTEDTYIRGSAGIDAETETLLKGFKFEPDKITRAGKVTSGEGRHYGPVLSLSEADKAKTPGLASYTGESTQSWVNPVGGLSLQDVIDMQVNALRNSGNDHGAKYFGDVLVPMVRGHLNKRHYTTLTAMHTAQRMSHGFANGAIGKAIEGSGSFGSRFVQSLREYGDRPLRYSDASALAANVSGWYYSTLMGLSVPTVMLNGMQPMLFAGSWLGYDNVLAGYVDGFKRLGSYMAARSRHGLRIDSATRRKLIQEHLDPEDVLSLSDDVLDQIDSPFSSQQTSGNLKYFAYELPLKGFEKAEWLNRLVTRHAHRRLMRQQRGRDPVGDEVINDLDDFRRILSNTQYTVSAESIPQIMAGTTDQQSVMGRALTNPMVRQFMQFPVRTLTSLTAGSRIVGGGMREIPGMGAVDLGMGASIYDAARMVGASALLYEGGRAVLDADIARGLAPSVFTDIIGGDRFLRDENAWVPVPPAFGVPIDLMRGVLGNDFDEVRSALWRFVPGGLAGSRLANILPPLPVVGPTLQKTYAAWNNPMPDGTIGVYDQSGRMVEAVGGSELIMRGLGLDMQRHRDAISLNQTMMRNRDRYKEAQRQAMTAMLSNDMRRAKAVQGEWEAKTGIPLRISRNQLDTAMRNRDTPMAERIYNSMPMDMRTVMSGQEPALFGSDLGG